MTRRFKVIKYGDIYAVADSGQVVRNFAFRKDAEFFANSQENQWRVNKEMRFLRKK